MIGAGAPNAGASSRRIAAGTGGYSRSGRVGRTSASAAPQVSHTIAGLMTTGTVLVTSGADYIGSHTVRQLLAAGYRVPRAGRRSRWPARPCGIREKVTVFGTDCAS